jgi:O-antigen/teichoic acid export membrane protein
VVGRQRLLPSWAGHWARDSGLLLGSQLLTIGATTLAAVLIARHLQPSEWGIFSAFLGLSFGLAVFVEFGLASWLLRELSGLYAEQGEAAGEDSRRLVAAGLGFALVAGALIVALGAAAGALAGQRGASLFVLSALLLYGGLWASCNVLEAELRARRRLRRVVAASVLEKYVLVSLVAAAFLTGGGLWGVGGAYAVAGLLRLSLLGWSVFGRRLPARPRAREVTAVVRASLPFALTSGALSVVPRLDALGLLAFSAVAAGYFALGDRILAPLALVPGIAATALFPFLARRAHTVGAVWRLAGAFGLAGGILAIVAFVSAPTLVPLIFGSGYADAVPAVQIMVLALPLVYAANPLLVYSYTFGRERSIAATILVASLTGTAAILTGQALVGVTGAAAGFLVRQVLVSGGFVLTAVRASRADTRPFEPRLPSPIEGSL